MGEGQKFLRGGQPFYVSYIKNAKENSLWGAKFFSGGHCPLLPPPRSYGLHSRAFLNLGGCRVLSCYLCHLLMNTDEIFTKKCKTVPSRIVCSYSIAFASGAARKCRVICLPIISSIFCICKLRASQPKLKKCKNVFNYVISTRNVTNILYS